MAARRALDIECDGQRCPGNFVAARVDDDLIVAGFGDVDDHGQDERVLLRGGAGLEGRKLPLEPELGWLRGHVEVIRWHAPAPELDGLAGEVVRQVSDRDGRDDDSLISQCLDGEDSIERIDGVLGTVGVPDESVEQTNLECHNARSLARRYREALRIVEERKGSAA